MTVLVYMRKFFVLLAILFSISVKTCEEKGEEKTYDYDDFTELKISWKNLFSPAKSQYFVYFYSVYCSHCNNVKDDILPLIYANKEYFYLMEYKPEIPIEIDAYLTIGKSQLDEIWILGTPSLIGIVDGAVNLNIGGEKSIKDFVTNYPTYISRDIK